MKTTIVTAWDGLAYCTPDCVNRLFRSCSRNTSIPFDFLVYAGPHVEAGISLDAGIKIIPVDLPYWWSSVAFWMKDPPGVETESRLFIDLDVVVVGSLDDLITYPSDFCCSRDYPDERTAPLGHYNDVNTGVSLLRGAAGAWVWDAYVAAGRPVWNPLPRDGARGPLPLSHQGVINEVQHRERVVDLFPESWCTSYKLYVIGNGIPEDCRTVHFHGKPKPWDRPEIPFVEEHWR